MVDRERPAPARVQPDPRRYLRAGSPPGRVEAVRPRDRAGDGMSWLEDLSGELYARGVARRDRVRIVAELSDHIACEPGCEERLGDPRALATSFADELATAEARGSAFATFGALAVAAVALAVSLITLGRFAHYPGYSNGLSTALFFPALLGMVV